MELFALFDVSAIENEGKNTMLVHLFFCMTRKNSSPILVALLCKFNVPLKKLLFFRNPLRSCLHPSSPASWRQWLGTKDRFHPFFQAGDTMKRKKSLNSDLGGKL